nr:thiamine phosphate phosphatase-like protein [Tanacetum cinerariifolium]
LYIDAKEHELGDLGEPANYKDALLDPESKKWLDVMNVKMQSMKDNDVWVVLVELPPNTRTVESKWLFKKKTDMDGAVYNFKARLVTKGFTQTYGVDYEETFSLVADIRDIRILVAIAAYYDYEIWKMDVKTAFLNGHLSEEDRMMEEIHSRGKTIKDIVNCLNRVPLHSQIVSAIQSAHAQGCDLKFLSDVNQFFIETILKNHGVYDCFLEIITNPTVVDKEGRLRIFGYHGFEMPPHGCDLCPPNLCK